MPSSLRRVRTFFSENFATWGSVKPEKAFRKFGHFFSIILQFNPAVNIALVILSKYSASLFGGLAPHGLGMLVQTNQCGANSIRICSSMKSSLRLIETQW